MIIISKIENGKEVKSKDGKENLSESVLFRMTPLQSENLDIYAKQLGLKKSEFIRKAIEEKMQRILNPPNKVTPKDALLKMMSELLRQQKQSDEGIKKLLMRVEWGNNILNKCLQIFEHMIKIIKKQKGSD